MTQLVRYDAAKKALAEAKAVDEVKQLHDVSAAMRAYAIQAKDRQLEIDASEIRIRAERRLGEMIREQKETVGLNRGTAGAGDATVGRGTGGASWEPPVDAPPTLADAGISKKLSSRSQAIAGIPEEDFEATLVEHREEQQAVTASTMEKLAKKAHVSHNSGKNEWYTPAEYIEAAREVMGSIDCDPASSDIANATVRSDEYFTEVDDGLVQTWRGNVWMNPPYTQPLIRQFSEALVEKYQSGEVKQACVLVNNATETAWFQMMAQAASAFCFPKGRIRFVDPKGNLGAPLQGQALLYFGSDTQRFVSAFSGFGFCGVVGI
jgi:ParB family chromosome partitioning protein